MNNNEGEGDSNDTSTSNSDNVIKFGRILTGFHERLMFVDNSTHIEIHTIYCIDKIGKTVFSTEASHIISGFHNGLALVMQEKAVLCDKTGKIITAEELGGTSFVYDEPEIFNDGFILVTKTSTSYQGSVDEMAVFNANLEKIVDFSADLYNDYKNEYSYNGTQYYNGYLFNYNFGNDSILNLRTGTKSTDFAQWCQTLELKNETDFLVTGESFEKYYIYDYREALSTEEYDPEVTPIIDLSETGGRISSENQLGFGFVDGYAALVFEVEDSEVGERHYFTIMDKNGDYCFEPVEVAGKIEAIKNNNGVFVLSIVPRNFDEQTCYIEVYDISGRIGVKEYKKPNTSFWSIDFGISDGVIFIQYDDYNALGKEWIGVYNTNMQPLFDVEIITVSQ